MWALASAISAWLVIPVAPAILALVLARQAQESMHAWGTSGQGLLTAARILGWLNISVWAGIVVGVAILLVALLVFGGLTASLGPLLG